MCGRRAAASSLSWGEATWRSRMHLLSVRLTHRESKPLAEGRSGSCAVFTGIQGRGRRLLLSQCISVLEIKGSTAVTPTTVSAQFPRGSHGHKPVGRVWNPIFPNLSQDQTVRFAVLTDLLGSTLAMPSSWSYFLCSLVQEQGEPPGVREVLSAEG